MMKKLLLFLLLLGFIGVNAQHKFLKLYQLPSQSSVLKSSYSEIDDNLFDNIPYLYTKGDDTLFIKKRPATFGTYFSELINKIGKNKFKYLMNLDLYSFKEKYDNEEDLYISFLMQHCYDFDLRRSPLMFRDNGDFYVLAYEKNFNTEDEPLNKNRKLFLFKWNWNNFTWNEYLEIKIDSDLSIINPNRQTFTISPNKYEEFKEFGHNIKGMFMYITDMNDSNIFNKRNIIILFIKTSNGFNYIVKNVDTSKYWLLPKNDNDVHILNKDSFTLKLYEKDNKNNSIIIKCDILNDTCSTIH